MKNVSRWASRHSRTAIPLLVLCETGNALSGMLMGANVLDNRSTGILLLTLSGLLASAFFIQTQSDRVAGCSYQAGRSWLFGAFMTNFFLFVLLGGLLSSGISRSSVTPTAWGSRQLTIQSDTLVKPRNARTSNPDYVEESHTAAEQPIGDQTGKRIGFVLLFLLGIVLSVSAAALSCNLACSGNGTLAAIVFLTGAGIMLSSFFLLSRAFGKVIKPWKQMNRTERRKTYFRGLFLMGGFYALLVLLGSINR